MNNLQSITTAYQYRQKYKQLLKGTPTKKQLKEFNQAVEHYKQVFPDWRNTNF